MQTVETRIANMLYPLTDFYASVGAQVPRITVMDGSEMSQPYRRLLVHNNDMTPTLEAYCGQAIHLKPLRVRVTDEALYRQVLLVVNGAEWPIEFGAIRIDLPRFEEEPRRLIVEGYRPLGTILHQHAIQHRSKPSAFFAVEADAVIADAFGIEPSVTLYGRHNTIYNPKGGTLAEVVEILPPLEKSKELAHGS